MALEIIFSKKLMMSKVKVPMLKEQFFIAKPGSSVQFCTEYLKLTSVNYFTKMLYQTVENV